MNIVKKKFIISISIFIMSIVLFVSLTENKKVNANERCENTEELLEVAYIDAPKEINVNKANAGYIQIRTNVNKKKRFLYKLNVADTYNEAMSRNWIFNYNENTGINGSWNWDRNESHRYVTNYGGIGNFTFAVADNYKLIAEPAKIPINMDNIEDFYNQITSSTGGTDLINLSGETTENDAQISSVSMADFKNCTLLYNTNFINTYNDDWRSGRFSLLKTEVSSIPQGKSLCYINVKGEPLSLLFIPVRYVFSLVPTGIKEIEHTFTWPKEEGKILKGAVLKSFEDESSDFLEYNNENLPLDFKTYSLKNGELGIDTIQNTFDINDITYNEETGNYSLSVTLPIDLSQIPSNQQSIPYPSAVDDNQVFIPFKLVLQYEENCNCSNVNINSVACCKNEDYFLAKNPTTNQYINLESCCYKEKSNRLLGNSDWEFYPNSLISEYGRAYCSSGNSDCNDIDYFRSNKTSCCTNERNDGKRGNYLPNIYTYDNVCGEATSPNCTQDTFFDNNVDECCEKERNDGINGNFLPNNRNYNSYCNRVVTSCDTETEVRNHPLTCCDGNDSNGEATGTLYDNYCLIINSPKTCDSNEFSKNETTTESSIKIKDTIKFSEYPKKDDLNNLQIYSGTGFKYPITVTNNIVITPEYPNNDIQDTEEEATELDNKYRAINAKFDNKFSSIINEIKSKYSNQIIRFNIKSNTNEEHISMIIDESFNTDLLDSVPKEQEINNTIIKYRNCVAGECSIHEKTSVKKYKPTTIEFIYKVKLPYAYILKNSNTVEYKSTRELDDNINYIYGGNKYYTNINDITQTLDFSVTIENGGGSGKVIINESDFTCSLNTYNCIIYGTCPVEEKPYYFRTISLTNPFPNRIAGQNWGSDDITKTSKYIWKNPTPSNNTSNSDDIYSRVPLYQITLTSSLINDIKIYNNTHNYLNWDSTMFSTDKESISKFLSGEGTENSFMSNKLSFNLERTEKIGDPREEVD